MKLLFLANCFPSDLGGVERYNWELCASLGRLGHDVTVLSVASADRSLPDASDVPFVLHDRCVRNSEAPAELGLLLERLRPDAVLVSRVSRSLRRVMAVLRHRNIPTFPFAHGLRSHETRKDPLRRWLKWRIFGFDIASVVFCNSADTQERLLQFKIPPERISVIYPGVDVETICFSPIGRERVRKKHHLEERRVLLTLGRLVRNKRVDALVSLLPRLVERIPDVHLLIVGEGDQRPKLAELAAALGVAERLTLAGGQEDVTSYYSAADAFALVSSSKNIGAHAGEGFGMVYAEAGAVGLPCVASNEGGIPEVVEHEETGLLVDPLDDDAVLEALTRVLEDRELAQRLGTAARRRVEERFTWEGSARRVAEQVTHWVTARPNA